jgi:hypothetical protein
MKWIVGVSIFFATALGWIATTTMPAATITPDEATLKYFPPETESIAFVDVAALRDVPLVHDALYQGQMKSITPEIGGFIDSTGFDVRRDLDSVMIGRSGRDHLIVANARYDKFKTEQFLKDKGKDPETYLGRAIYHDNDAAIACLDGVILLGTDTAVKKAIDQMTYPGAVQLRSDLLDSIRTIEAGNQVWAVGSFSPQDLPAVAVRETPVLQILKTVRHGTYQMRIDRDVHARAIADFADAENARNLSDMARGFIAVAKLQIAKQQPDFLQVLDGIDVRSSGSSVTVRIDEAGDLLMKLEKARLQPRQLGQ